MLLSDSVGGADESRNGFRKRIPVKVVDRSTLMGGLPAGADGFQEGSAVRARRKEGNLRAA
jgi:hypothetical protein